MGVVVFTKVRGLAKSESPRTELNQFNLSQFIFLFFRCNMYVGLGYTLVARNVENQSDRKDLLSKAEYHYKAALGAKYLSFFSSHYLKTREKYILVLLSFVYFLQYS